MNKLVLKKGAEKRLLNGHLWVFSNEVSEHPSLSAGSTVEIIASNGKSFGKAFYNPSSLISARLLLHSSDLSVDFFKERIITSYKFRRQALPGENSFRLIFGEADLLPGLIVDKYEDYLSLQTLSAGMEVRKDLLISALTSAMPDIKGIYEKNASALRSYEGLPDIEGVLFGEIPGEIMISENGVKYSVSIQEGQKTGFYFDQRFNRSFLKKISSGVRILDCFTNQGGFALNCSIGGADKVVGADSSASAINRARNNALLNNLKNVEFIESDVVELLRGELSSGSKYDIVILDPPAYAKSKKTLKTAIGGYANINRLALKLLNRGGFLATASCSQHLSEDSLFDIVNNEAARQNINLRMIYRGGHPPDHPVLSSMNETGYLKFFVFQIL